jgi:deoxyribodipyrimidine photo-lyase
MKKLKVLFWFRQDLRVRDNPGLSAAAEVGEVLPIYILDESQKEFVLGSASKWWLHQSLNSLNKELNNHLQVYVGDSVKIIQELIKSLGISGVYINRCYEPQRLQQQKSLKEALAKQKVELQSFNGSLLWEPWENLKSDETPFKVFTPFHKGLMALKKQPRKPIPAPSKINFLSDNGNKMTIDDLHLMPKIKWYSTIAKTWLPGEEHAHKRLNFFLENVLAKYEQGRNFPGDDGTSRLSPYLHHGEISPNQIWHAVAEKKYKIHYSKETVDKYQAELCWREFAYYVLYHFPYCARDNLNSKFDTFPWKKGDSPNLKAWQKGQTGIPIVDAGMRELWQTGYMHNRVRMIVGSLLVKNLGIHWLEGADWFWDTLCDADLASNSMGWQWVAGCGVDASPFFRIFNPTTQGERFDADGKYTRKYVPELEKIPNKYLHCPWLMPKAELKKLGIVLGKDYPLPIVDLAQSRDKALKDYGKTYGVIGGKGTRKLDKDSEDET